MSKKALSQAYRRVGNKGIRYLIYFDPQLSFDDAQAGTFHASRARCCFCRQAIARRLGTYVVTILLTFKTILYSLVLLYC